MLVPTMRSAPVATPSGRSVTSRKTRAGTPRPVQEADHARLASTGSLPVEALA